MQNPGKEESNHKHTERSCHSNSRTRLRPGLHRSSISRRRVSTRKVSRACLQVEETENRDAHLQVGKMVCTGAKSERQARKAVMKVVDELEKNGIVIAGNPAIQTQNIVASVVLGGSIDLEKTTYSLERTMYEPEQFPGLIYRMRRSKGCYSHLLKRKLGLHRREEGGRSWRRRNQTSGDT